MVFFFLRKQFWRLKCHAATYTTCLMSDLSICVSASVAQQPPCLFIWQFYMCIAESSQGKVSNTSIHIAQCFTLLVCICMCLCLCRTECPLNVLSGLPDRLLLCVILFLPSVEVKKKTTHRTWHGGLYLTRGLRFSGTQMMKIEPTPLLFFAMFVYFCVETLRLHLPGNS